MNPIRYAFLLALLLLLGTSRPAIAQVVEWSRLDRNLSRNNGAVQAATTDLAGNTYAAVRYDSVRAGNTRINALGGGDILIKHDSTGQVAWTLALNGVFVDNQGLKVDPATGNFFVSGALFPGATWNGSPLPANPSNYAYFYAKCSPTGALLWARARPYLRSPALAADALGNCYLLGRAVGTTTVGGISADSSTVLLVKADGTGTVQWQRKLRGSLPVGTSGNVNLYSYGMGAQPNGGVLVFGQFQASLYFDSGTTPVQTGPGAVPVNFMANVDGAGALRWSIPTIGLARAATADAAGSCYLTGGAFPIGGVAQYGIGVAKYNSAGVGQWSSLQANTSGGYESGRLIAVDNAGAVTVVAEGGFNASTPPTLGTLPLRAPYNVVHFNAQGQAQWVANDWRPGQNFTSALQYAYAAGLGVDIRGNVYYATESKQNLNSATPLPVVQFGSFTLVGAGLGVSRLGIRHNTIAGRVYFDLNANGVRDAGEGPFPAPVVLVAPQAAASGVATPDAAGNYQLYTGPGAYSLSIPQLLAHYTVSQPGNGTYTGSFAGFGGLDSARHLGIQAIANQADVRATLTPYGTARAGFTTRYRLTVENVGTTTVAGGTATVTLDSRMAYISSTPSASRTGQVLTWPYGSLAPFARQEFDVLFSLPTNTVAGTVLNTAATAPLAADVVPADNTAALAQTVVGSYDPNSMEVNYERLTPAQISAQQPLDYTIHFQNLGTAAAITVLLSDTLDFRKLNLASLMLVAQSHSCLWSLATAGPDKGLLTVRFLNINLPERNVDVIRSQGFVRFRVQPRTTLAVGEVIPNHAGIVFDYNAPVITNTATTTVFQATAALARHDAPAWTAYPNPATDAISLDADLATAGPVSIELLDVLGRPLRQQIITAPAGSFRQTLNLHGLAAGVYLLRLTPPTGPATSRRVVLH
ncbi:T9SS type A sorting domain-containing protein [Microvirga sp. STS02]|uniref:DUF7619 domain-containing protein n=1 Tax=Hymenobacter negativus TaxID=2795026 RepID=UPI0018DBC0C6|nr:MULTISPECIES: T9SS type A sorting domain-containing protein [Bacteria]MBH8570357.1 T9SS type A sorting domain-containing protein [Hymenobacter negativus]MBR7210096.1 T9SS type A sorting domain-containing protein [Microvirga sp. STS02]